MKFGQKLRLKKNLEYGILTAQTGDVFQVVNYDHKYGMELHHPRVRDLMEFKYSPQNRDKKIKEYFEIIEEYDDRLAELEALILIYYFNKGYKLEKDQQEGDVSWTFMVNISSNHKSKSIFVGMVTDDDEVDNNEFEGTTTKEIFDKGIKYFSGIRKDNQ